MTKGKRSKSRGGSSHQRKLTQGSTAKELPKQSLPSQKSPIIEPKTSTGILQWLRGIGISSTLLGAFGLWKDFFVISVICVFLGILILILDLGFERFRKFDATRFIGMALLAGAAVLFGKEVVLHEDPLDYIADIYPANGVITVSLYNTSASDYQNLDIKIQPVPVTLIDSAKEDNGVAGVEIVEDNKPGGPRILSSDSKDPALAESVATANGRTYTNFQRVRCATLPKNSPMKLELILKSGESMPQKVRIHGTYQGKYQSRQIDVITELVGTKFGLLDKQ